MKIKTFHEIIAWQKAHLLVLEIYKITKTFPKTELFGLTSQMRRCAVSIPSNLVEGFKRRSTKDSIYFYNISEGSLEELKYQLILSCDLKYISPATLQDLQSFTNEVGKLLHGWISVQK